MDFRRLCIEDKTYYESFLNADTAINRSYAASELNFSNLFCWNVSDNIWYYPTETAIYIKAIGGGGEVYFLPPLVKRDEDFLPALFKIEEYLASQGLPLVVRSLTKEMVEALGQERERYEIVYNRDYSEYLYDPAELAALAGRKFAQKRNHLNYFLANYDFSYRPYEERDKQGLINLVQQWKIATGNTEVLEEIAIDNAIAYYDQLGLRCEVIESGGAIIAFSIGFINRNNIGIVMFEKADTSYRGSFNAINNMFVKDFFMDCRYVNRQEDMGIEGLRRAKLGYNPVAMADKFDIVGKKG